MNKNELREKYKALRNTLTLSDIDDLSISIANQLLKLPIWDYTFYHIFLTIEEQKEVNTDYILNILSGKDKNILISKSDFETYTMTHFLLTDNTIIKKNPYNIPEPIDGIEIPNKNIEVVFIPLLAYDHLGNRIGYGKGFYDRFLEKCNPETIKIGLSFFEADSQMIEAIENDITLNYCISPHTIYNFK